MNSPNKQFLSQLLKKHLCPDAEAHTGHGGRNKHRLFIPQINTLIGKNGFFYHGSCDLEQFTSCLIYS